MSVRKIFYKNNKNKKIIFYSLLSFIIVIIFFYIFTVNFNKKFVIVSENKDIFYVIPEDKGGEKIQNLDKKSLNLKSQNQFEIIINNPDELFFSIQFFVDNNLTSVTKYLEKITAINESIYNKEDFYILSLNSEIGIEYFLIYKNFQTRESANKYCLDFLNKIEKCLIVDSTKF